LPEIRHELRPVGFSISGITEVVDFKRQTRKSEIGKHSPQQGDDFDISAWIGHAKRFHAELVKLAQSASLWPLVAKHRPQIEILLRDRISRAVVLDVCPYRPGGPFGPKGQRCAIPVLERVHLLLHDVS
jgi:hypothetical protein